MTTPTQAPMRAYSMSDWQGDFARASLPTQARGPLLAADNDEPELCAACVTPTVCARDSRCIRRPWPSFAQIDAEANAEARAILRGDIPGTEGRAGL